MKPNIDEITAEVVNSKEVHEQGYLSPDAKMVGFTWLTFFLLLAILYKFAFKPILAALDDREEAIRKSVTEAERIKQEFEEIAEKRNEILKQSQYEAKKIIDDARKAAVEAGKNITHKARQESQILLENAKREIDEEKNNAQAQLKEQSIRIAVNLAAQIIEENLDEEKNTNLINRLIKKI